MPARGPHQVHDPAPPRLTEKKETLYLYFEHANDILRRDPKAITESPNVVDEILKSDPKLGTALLNKRTLQRLDYLVGQGYWLDSVKGYTSPEGRRGPSAKQPGPAAKWEGNNELSRRAKKVRELIEARYGDNELAERDLPPRMRFPAGKRMPSGSGPFRKFRGWTCAPVSSSRAPCSTVSMIQGGVKFECSNWRTNKAPDKGPFVKQCPKELPRMTEGDRMYVTNQRLSDRKRGGAAVREPAPRRDPSPAHREAEQR